MLEQIEVGKNESRHTLVTQVTTFGTPVRVDSEGNIMRFDGYWVSADASNPEVSIGEFDDTDLSDHSDWKEAWQNDDLANAHGFIDPLAMLQSVSARIIGTLTDDELQKAWAELRGGNPLRVNDAASFAKLVQMLIPKSLPQQPHHANASPLVESGDEIPFLE